MRASRVSDIWVDDYAIASQVTVLARKIVFRLQKEWVGVWKEGGVGGRNLGLALPYPTDIGLGDDLTLIHMNMKLFRISENTKFPSYLRQSLGSYGVHFPK